MIKITEATVQDVPLIRQLAKQTFHITYLPLLPKEKVDYLFGLMYSVPSLAEQMKNGQQFIVAKGENGHQGYASYEINCKKTGVTKIHKLYVLPTAQGKGIGKILVDCIATKARENKNQTLALNVYRNNPAFEFYKKIGFKKMREVNIDAGDGFMFNDFEMEMDL